MVHLGTCSYRRWYAAMGTKIIQMSRPDLVGFLLVFHLILLSFPLDSSS
nr:MAG TPA: hypothetical protein [Caudoviricetes sp.]